MSIPYWRLSSFYWFYFAALGAFIPYWGLYLKQAGFDTVQIGQLSALLVGCKIVAPNCLGWLADHTGKSLPLVRLASFLAALGFCGFLYAHNYSEYISATLVFSFFWSAALPQFEAATLAHLKTEAHRYSQIRLWGSVGFIAAVLGLGALIDWQPLTILPAIMIALLTGIGAAALIVPEARAISHDNQPLKLWRILKNPEVIAFFVVCMLLQTAHSPYYVFYSIVLKQHHYSSTIIGGLWALGVVAEIVLFIFMRRLLARCSLRALLLASISLAIVRWLLIAYLADSTVWLLAAQLLHAMTFGGTHIASIHLVHRYFGSQHQGKGQALYNSFSAGLGGMVGSYASGYYFDAIGATGIYTAAAFCCALALLIAYLWIGREGGNIFIVP
ncbi:MAG: MFS transporter [Methylovulum sp.]|uniref:MFS transporter n=1 Tax=Methylovulum sp. TaxID=1916980 RepID=UPI002616D861|nr:MFS transporter [Methylovulum sp.]MDD2724630.1 MFS transporter [Methylovulum sp.]MDD5123457.1 MFS transporter [Methylovulum sp.]